MFIGEKLKALRKKNHITLSDLAQKSGVQLATLSRIENKKMVGTLESHINIAQALGVDITELDKNIETSDVHITEADPSPADVFTHNDSSSYLILAKNIFRRRMMPILLKIKPGAKTTVEENSPGSEKFIYIMKGKVTIHTNNQSETLSKDQTLYLDASKPHYYKNSGAQEAVILSICTPVQL